MSAELSIDQRVIIGGRKVGTIAFIGKTQFSEGEWIGVILDKPIGKNDGSVNNIRYFACQDKYGLFVKPNQIKPYNQTSNDSLLSIKEENRSSSSINEPLVFEEKDNKAILSEDKSTDNTLIQMKIQLVAKEQIIAQLKEKIADFEDKLEVLKSKRAEDRAKLKEIEKLKIQLQQLLEYKLKMMESHTRLQQELKATKTELEETKEKYTDFDNQIQELSDLLEMATLDKEMAEEKLDGLQTQIETLREELNDKTLKYNVLLDETKTKLVDASGLTGKDLDGIPHVTLHQYRLLDDQNAKLKEGLIKLRDMLATEKADRIKLNKELDEVRKNEIALLKERDKLATKLKESEISVFELREQVDASLGAEEMIEALTNKYLDYEQKNTELSEALEDLEKLQDINEEIQENFKEIERELRQERDKMEIQLERQTQKLNVTLASVREYEATTLKYRQLVSDLRAKNQEMTMQIQQLHVRIKMLEVHRDDNQISLIASANMSKRDKKYHKAAITNSFSSQFSTTLTSQAHCGTVEVEMFTQLLLWRMSGLANNYKGEMEKLKMLDVIDQNLFIALFTVSTDTQLIYLETYNALAELIKEGCNINQPFTLANLLSSSNVINELPIDKSMIGNNNASYPLFIESLKLWAITIVALDFLSLLTMKEVSHINPSTLILTPMVQTTDSQDEALMKDLDKKLDSLISVSNKLFLNAIYSFQFLYAIFNSIKNNDNNESFVDTYKQLLSDMSEAFKVLLSPDENQFNSTHQNNFQHTNLINHFVLRFNNAQPLEIQSKITESCFNLISESESNKNLDNKTLTLNETCSVLLGSYAIDYQMYQALEIYTQTLEYSFVELENFYQLDVSSIDDALTNLDKNVDEGNNASFLFNSYTKSKSLVHKIRLALQQIIRHHVMKLISPLLNIFTSNTTPNASMANSISTLLFGGLKDLNTDPNTIYFTQAIILDDKIHYSPDVIDQKMVQTLAIYTTMSNNVNNPKNISGEKGLLYHILSWYQAIHCLTVFMTRMALIHATALKPKMSADVSERNVISTESQAEFTLPLLKDKIISDYYNDETCNFVPENVNVNLAYKEELKTLLSLHISPCNAEWPKNTNDTDDNSKEIENVAYENLSEVLLDAKYQEWWSVSFSLVESILNQILKSIESTSLHILKINDNFAQRNIPELMSQNGFDDNKSGSGDLKGIQNTDSKEFYDITLQYHSTMFENSNAIRDYLFQRFWKKLWSLKLTYNPEGLPQSITSSELTKSLNSKLGPSVQSIEALEKECIEYRSALKQRVDECEELRIRYDMLDSKYKLSLNEIENIKIAKENEIQSLTQQLDDLQSRYASLEHDLLHSDSTQRKKIFNLKPVTKTKRIHDPNAAKETTENDYVTQTPRLGTFTVNDIEDKMFLGENVNISESQYTSEENDGTGMLDTNATKRAVRLAFLYEKRLNLLTKYNKGYEMYACNVLSKNLKNKLNSAKYPALLQYKKEDSTENNTFVPILNKCFAMQDDIDSYLIDSLKENNEWMRNLKFSNAEIPTKDLVKQRLNRLERQKKLNTLVENMEKLSMIAQRNRNHFPIVENLNDNMVELGGNDSLPSNFTLFGKLLCSNNTQAKKYFIDHKQTLLLKRIIDMCDNQFIYKECKINMLFI